MAAAFIISIDNGYTWTLLQQTSSNIKGLVNRFNAVSQIVVSPTTSSVFISSIGYSICRSTNGQIKMESKKMTLTK